MQLCCLTSSHQGSCTTTYWFLSLCSSSSVKTSQLGNCWKQFHIVTTPIAQLTDSFWEWHCKSQKLHSVTMSQNISLSWVNWMLPAPWGFHFIITNDINNKSHQTGSCFITFRLGLSKQMLEILISTPQKRFAFHFSFEVLGTWSKTSEWIHWCLYLQMAHRQ